MDKTGGFFAPTLLIPGIKAHNHAIVRAEVNGKTWWLDPTNPVFTPSRTMSDLQERWVLQETIPAETPDATE
ncbi:hypothetical protein [Candidatus Regiella insecticola]|uniref:hypothetical protein n=1 Tax=Candidatus Regiella insecticola TaxID=138073 RepID=UPI001C3F3F73|nr:hypothetical protein [Candidatus Regiella insecticola]